ncbi:hypothetical protein, partial [Mycobacterium avium]|uniref:hypothetical protein n=1 Tax=Mycobacterium avium TaxID=1764 RepID=UPI001CDAC2BE
QRNLAGAKYGVMGGAIPGHHIGRRTGVAQPIKNLLGELLGGHVEFANRLGPRTRRVGDGSEASEQR